MHSFRQGTYIYFIPEYRLAFWMIVEDQCQQSMITGISNNTPPLITPLVLHLSEIEILGDSGQLITPAPLLCTI